MSPKQSHLGDLLHPMLCPLGTGDFHKAECHSWQLLLEGQHFVYTRQSAIEGRVPVKAVPAVIEGRAKWKRGRRGPSAMEGRVPVKVECQTGRSASCD